MYISQPWLRARCNCNDTGAQAPALLLLLPIQLPSVHFYHLMLSLLELPILNHSINTSWPPLPKNLLDGPKLYSATHLSHPTPPLNFIAHPCLILPYISPQFGTSQSAIHSTHLLVRSQKLSHPRQPQCTTMLPCRDKSAPLPSLPRCSTTSTLIPP